MNEKLLLRATDLSAGYGGEDVIKKLSFELERGEILCVVGESGCGKTTLLRALLGSAGRVETTGGSLEIAGKAIMGDARHEDVGMRPQNPAAAFNPIRSYKKQFAETLKSHGKYEAGSFVEQCLDTLGALGLTDAERILKSCPCQLSGGMNQRMAIALCLMMEYELLLCDEPTSALDTVLRLKTAQELMRLRSLGRIGQIVVTHDLALARMIADKTAVMCKGRFTEYGRTDEVLRSPVHRYTQSLIAASPKLGGRIPESLRCGCSVRGEMREISPGHFVLCEDGKEVGA